MHGDVIALGGQVQGELAAQATGRAGDQDGWAHGEGQSKPRIIPGAGDRSRLAIT
jgi:hypothetical protein